MRKKLEFVEKKVRNILESNFFVRYLIYQTTTKHQNAMKTNLKFKKETIGVYEAKFNFNGDVYTFNIESGCSRYWGLSVYKNDAYIFGDGWDNSNKRTWVDVSQRIVKDLINGIEI